MIAREGYLIVAVAFLLAVLLVLLGWKTGLAVRAACIAGAVLVLGFTLFFFRDPVRVPPAEAAAGNLLLAPADGKVILVEDIDEEPLYLKGPARQVSIFLSPLDVHVNRVPADGVIEYVEYVPGDYLVAWHPKASEQNERSILGLRHPSGARILFKQIAGAVARRVVYHLRVGDAVKAGERFGIVKFGSRMDVLVPPSVEIAVEAGDRVSAGVTVIGRISGPSPARTDTSAALIQDVSA